MKKDVAALVKSLPKRIKIGGHYWTIKVKEDWIKNEKDEDCWGNCSFNNMTISIGNTNGCPSGSVLISTFFHEVMHAVYWQQHLPNKVEEEAVVGSMENGLIAVFKDNPWLLEWMKKGLR